MWQYYQTPSPNELYHHGIKGMKWGVRRYQNKDGSLTPAGKKRYDSDAEGDIAKKTVKEEKSGWSTKKKVVVAGAAIAGTALAAYGTKKLHDHVRTENFRIREKQGRAEANKILRRYRQNLRKTSVMQYLDTFKMV